MVAGGALEAEAASGAGAGGVCTVVGAGVEGGLADEEALELAGTAFG